MLKESAVVVLVAVAMTGCIQSSGSVITPSSHFVYPNSNVTPLKEARAGSSKLCGLLFIPFSTPNANQQNEAVAEAIKSVDADVLINVRSDYSTFVFPGLFQICSVSVQGTGAKMDIGRQDISTKPAAAACKRDKDCPGSQICNAGKCSE